MEMWEKDTTCTLTSVSLLRTMNLGNSHYHTSLQSLLCKDSLGGQIKEDSKWGLGQEINVEMSVLTSRV